jgi:hypothetical protein
MTRATKYVALDVHQATALASVRAETGRVIARTIVPTEAQAVTEFFRGMRGAVHVAFEEGRWLASRIVDGIGRVHNAAGSSAGGDQPQAAARGSGCERHSAAKQDGHGGHFDLVDCMFRQ